MFENTKFYKAGYSSDLIRGIDEPRPWNLTSKILKFTQANSSLLDIGSGDARKMLPLAKDVKHITAMEPSAEMRELAGDLILQSNINNITICDGIANNLPFENESFDLVTCSLAPWNANEVARVLKPGGYFINETIGYADKYEFKVEFGKNANNEWRGQLLQLDRDDFLSKIRNDLEPVLSVISMDDGFWNTYYSEDGLLELCKHTPTIQDFDLIKDNTNFNNAIKKLLTPNGIAVQQNRILTVAVKN